jgi:hypothetical protein
MDIACPNCRSAIATDDVNVATDIALCRRCEKTFGLSQLINQSTASGPDLAAPPPGAWFEQTPGGFRVGATTRSATAFFLVPFACVWSGGSVGSIYGKQITSGQFDLGDSAFGVPFLLGTFALIGACAMMIAGKVEVTAREDRLSVFTGVGLLGWTRSHPLSDFTFIREEIGGRGFNRRGQGTVIVMEGKRRLTFGSMLSDNRRYFIVSALRKMIRNSNPTSSTTIAPPRFR